MVSERSATLIVNPNTGRRAVAAAGWAAAWLERRGWNIRLEPTQHPGHATLLARRASREGTGVIVACGGDGTLNEVVNGVVGAETAVAMLPLGTTNVWARCTGVPRDLSGAVRLLEEGVRKTVDVGLAGERYFLQMAGMGWDGEVVRRMGGARKGRWGLAKYALYAVRTGWNLRPIAVDMRVDDEQIHGRALMAVWGNTPLYGNMFFLTPRAEADDGLLDLCVFFGGGRRDLLRHLFNVLLHRHECSHGAASRRTREVLLRMEGPAPFQVDGEYVGQAPERITVVPRALTVILPARPSRACWPRGEPAEQRG